jgi:predicted transcriptional regulator
MSIILSIKPKYAKMIHNHDKLYELRKTSCPLGRVYLYNTAPVKAFTGWMVVDEVIQLPQRELWHVVYRSAGVTYDEFAKYFNNTKKPYAWHVDKTYHYDYPVHPRDLAMYEDMEPIPDDAPEDYPDLPWESWRPPQSWCRLNDADLERRLRHIR